MERKSVRYLTPTHVPETEVKVRTLLTMSDDSVSDYYNSYYPVEDTATLSAVEEGVEEAEFRMDDAIRDFVAPTICSLCSDSIASVTCSVDANHAQLLLTMVRLYGNRALVRSVFSAMESSHTHLLRDFRGEHHILKKKLLVICTVLVKAARLDEGCGGGQALRDHTDFTADIMESVLLLLKCELVDCDSSKLFLVEIIKVRGREVWEVCVCVCVGGVWFGRGHGFNDFLFVYSHP